MWRNLFGRGFGPVVWQITDDDDTFFVKFRLFRDSEKSYVWYVITSWKPLYLIFQVLYQSSGTNWPYHSCMQIFPLIKVALYVIVYMQFFGHTFSLLTKKLQDLAVMNRISKGSKWARLKALHCVYVFDVFLYFTGLLRGNWIVSLSDGINSNSWSWRPNNLKTHRGPCFSRIYGLFCTVSDRYL